jgi:kumamolisin
VVVPQSRVVRSQDAGLRAHTNIRVLQLPDARAAPPALHGVQPRLPPVAGNFYETPASLACIYGLVKRTYGCNLQRVTTNLAGGSRVIAIVDAYDDPTALADLANYSLQFGLPAVTAMNFQVIYASGVRPPVDGGWRLEAALDTQMAHALAPGAKIILVEAASNSFPDLLRAEHVAANAVAAAGGGEVSNSWGSDEFASETTSTYTSPFTKTKVVFFAPTGDAPPPSYPAVLRNVVAAGGTTVLRDASGGFQGEASWVDAGAGRSAFVSRPSYQAAVQSVVGTKRGIADLAVVANPNTGVWVRSNGAWYVVGGTSVSSPVLAAITNTAGHFLAYGTAELSRIYANLGTAAFRDIKTGACGTNQSLRAVTGYDLCTGVGSPFGRNGL